MSRIYFIILIILFAVGCGSGAGVSTGGTDPASTGGSTGEEDAEGDAAGEDSEDADDDGEADADPDAAPGTATIDCSADHGTDDFLVDTLTGETHCWTFNQFATASCLQATIHDGLFDLQAVSTCVDSTGTNHGELLKEIAAGLSDFSVTAKLTYSNIDLGSAAFSDSFSFSLLSGSDTFSVYMKLTYRTATADLRLLLSKSGGAATDQPSSSGFATTRETPLYLRLTKTGSTVEGFFSTDGTNFTSIGTQTGASTTGPYTVYLQVANSLATDTPPRVMIDKITVQ